MSEARNEREARYRHAMAILIATAEPDSDDLEWAREDMGATATDDEIYELAARRARVRTAEEWL